MSTSKPNYERARLNWTVARIQAGILALVGAILGGLGLFVMTAWLVIQDGPHTGAHLKLLSEYFFGYTVTWTGSIVGFFYGVLVGGLVGWTVGLLYNAVVGVRLR